MGSAIRIDSNINNQIDESNKKIDEWKNLIKNLTENSTLNNYVLSGKREKLNKISKLKMFLVNSPVKNNIEKLWATFLWISHNIDYDFKSINSLELNGDQDADSVLGSGLSICAGYSNLFSLICESFNIPCISIIGYSKGFGYEIGKTKFKEVDHDWNAVFIDKKWQLVESTWGSGYGNNEEGYVRRFQPFWFLTPPEIFIYEHFPQDEKFQFLSQPLTLAEFEKLPNFKIEYFANNIKCLSHSSGVLSDQESLVFATPANKEISAKIFNIEKDSNEIKNAILLQRDYRSSNFQIDVSKLKSYNHKLSVFCGEKGEKEHNWIADFIIKPSTNESCLFCKKYYSFPEYIFLFEPKEMNLKINRSYLFRVFLIKKEFDIVLYDSRKQLILFQQKENEKHLWFLNYTPTNQGCLYLSILNKKKHLSTAFEYEIII